MLRQKQPRRVGVRASNVGVDIDRAGHDDLARRVVRLAGARAFRQTGRYASGVDTDVVTIYLGTTIASIQCQSLAHVAQVAAACTTVRAALRLVSA